MPSPDEQSPPSLAWETMIRWRVRHIEDPVERLRFLRHTVGDRRTWRPSARSGQAFWRRHRVRAGVLLALVSLWPAGRFAGAIRTWSQPVPVRAEKPAADPAPTVWLVEEQAGYETYSNGLRIEKQWTVANQPRRYRAFRLGDESPGGGEERAWPAGIVFHTTESHLVDFAPERTKDLKRHAAGVLEYVRNEKAYHYVIDRFGRVWRIVREQDVAFHAGNSVWADEESTYVNLNQSFLGVSVEAQTRSEDGRPSTNAAQVHALRVLSEMLRSKYRLNPVNCVTHAQVSVNPSNHQLSYHTDWAQGFPFAAIGLPDNYRLPSPAIWVFGFSYSPALMKLSDTPFWQGLLLGEDKMRQRATAHGQEAAAFRQRLRERYGRVLTSVRTAYGAVPSEGGPESKSPPAEDRRSTDEKRSG